MATEREEGRQPAREEDATADTQRHGLGQPERENQQLKRENEELRSLCSFLEQTAQDNKQLAAEWQSFGRYTASVLKNETETYESKSKLMEEQLKRLTSENKELREMCLYLDRSREDGEVTLTPPESAELLVHTRILRELNKKGGSIIPQYSGVTSQSTLKDSRMAVVRKREQLVSGGVEPGVAMAEMKKRMERLEREKLELIKSLSAAHLLAANTSVQSEHHEGKQPRLVPSSLPSVTSPPNPTHLLRNQSEDPPQPQRVSLEKIMNAVTLLDVCRRLDAADMNGYVDPREEREAAALRVLLGIAWQRVQEQTTQERASDKQQHS